MRIFKIKAKCDDRCTEEYIVDGVTKAVHNGYPLGIGGISGGDYIDFEIDLDTGKIVNWTVPQHGNVMTEFDLEEEDD